MAQIVRSISACGTQAVRGLARAASNGVYPRGMIEIREYTLKPEGAMEFFKLTAEYGDVRKALLPMLGCAWEPMHGCPCIHAYKRITALSLSALHASESRPFPLSAHSMFTTDVGPCLHKVTHMYHYKVRGSVFCFCFKMFLVLQPLGSPKCTLPLLPSICRPFIASPCLLAS